MLEEVSDAQRLLTVTSTSFDEATSVDDENSDTVVRVENAHKTYLLGTEGVAALRGVSLEVQRGEFLMLFGPSGGGKTSLLNLIGTVDQPTKGSISLAGARLTARTPDKRLAQMRLRKIGFVFQTFNLLSTLNAVENVEMPMVLAAELSDDARRARALALLASVGIAQRAYHMPSQLSGGEQQRVTIARAIANKPEILLLDEPTGDLDSRNTVRVMRLLDDLNREHNITMIMVTHDHSLKDYASRIVHLKDGKIVREEKGTRAARNSADDDASTVPLSANVATEIRSPEFYQP